MNPYARMRGAIVPMMPHRPAPRGMGLFDSMDVSTWGIGEWGLIIGGFYIAMKLFGDVGRVRGKVRRSRSRAKRRERLERDLAEL